MKDKVLISYHKDLKVSKNVQPVFFGKAKSVDYDAETNTELINPLQTVDEFTFYFLYCTINNITEKEQIASTQLLVLSSIMCKPLDFSLPIDSKDGKLTQIAKELSTPGKRPRTPNSIYQSVKRLRDKGYLVETEDRLIVPNAKFQYVRQVVKKQLETKGLATFDYIFKCFISNPNSKVNEQETISVDTGATGTSGSIPSDLESVPTQGRAEGFVREGGIGESSE